MTGPTHEDAVDRPVWQANSDSKSCTKCNREFTVFHRRHHCRGCGKLVCQQCSDSRITLPPTFNYNGPQRVCSACHTYVLTLQYEAKKQSGEVKPPDYPSLRAELLKRTLEYLRLPEPTWHQTQNAGGVVTSVQPVPNSPFVCVRNQTTVKAPPSKVQTVYADMNLWQKWNPHVKSRILEEIDGNARVLTAKSELPVIDPRDTVFLTMRWEGVLNLETGATEHRAGHFTTAAMSIAHPAYPPAPSKVVRAEMAISITQIEPSEDGKSTRFVSTVHMDPRGLLPPFLVNTLLGRGAEHLRGMARYVEDN